MSRYRHVSAMKADGFPVRAACAAAEVSPSAYYAWLERSTAPIEAAEIEAVAHALNGRPRKALGRRTPAEAFNEHLPLLQQAGVASIS
ncbi:MAG: hypothetical protein M0Z62_11505 [Actinomycetota bacterium]|nr:hypothetical protein [Actinomycetota bacterium]MDA8367564.1 hypothetical protein [Actinomycetota bacterium]